MPAIGAARMPTHGSWRPWVLTIVGIPCLSTVCRSRRIDDVGFSAIETRIAWPLEIPPRIPPA